MSEQSAELTGYRSEGARWGQLLALLGLTGFAISQPLLSVAGENPSIFTYAGVQGSGIIVFALILALVPPLVLWLVTVGVGLVDRRAGDLLFVGLSALLVALTVIQWVKSAGLEQGALLGLVGAAAAVGFGFVLTRIDGVAEWTRYTSPLPVIAVVLLMLSPTGQLVQTPDAVVADGSAGDGAATSSVVMIMLDELPIESMLAPDGSIDEVRFPNIAALAGESTWYPNYTAMAGNTLQSIPSILTGTNPSSSAPLWTSHPDSLFTLLAPTHELFVSETATQLCGYASCAIEGSTSGGQTSGVRDVLSQMGDVWRQRVSLGPVDPVDFGQFRDDDLVAAEETLDLDAVREATEEKAVLRPGRVDDFIDAVQPGATPGLYYLHLMLPHQPWMFYPDGQPFDGLNLFGIMPDPDNPEPWIMAELQQGHLFQAEYADRLVGEIIARLKETGRFDDSMVVVTADHGVGFTTYPNVREFNDDTIEEIAYVPLFIKSPGQSRGTVDESNLMAVDLVPTIAAEVGATVDWEVAGFPAGDPGIEARGPRKDFFDFNLTNGQLNEESSFDMNDHQPEASNRLVGPIGPGDNLVEGLVTIIGAEKYLDLPVSQLELSGGPQRNVAILQYDGFQKPPAVVDGRMIGTYADPDAGSTVLVAFNGTVVSAAPVRADGVFETVLPPGVQKPEGNEVTLYQVADDGTISQLGIS